MSKIRVVQVVHPNGPVEIVEREISQPGAGVAGWKPGQRVGIGCHGGRCGYCESYRRGNFFACQTAPHSSQDAQETLSFSVLAGVRPMHELFPMERVAEAYEHMS